MKTKRNIGFTLLSILAGMLIFGTLTTCDNGGATTPTGDQGETKPINGTTYVRFPGVDKDDFNKIIGWFETIAEHVPVLKTNITRVEIKVPGTTTSHSGKTLTVGSDITWNDLVDYAAFNGLFVAVLQNGKTVIIVHPKGARV